MSGTTQSESKAKKPLPELEGYEVLSPIAKGGMAEVFLARPKARPDSLVALKIMRPELCRNREFVSMFLDEARIASRLAHPNIATIYGLGQDRGHYFLAMELLRGRTLLELVDEALKRKSRLPYEVVAWIGARIAAALHYAHELRDESGAPHQIVHRDVNPSNIFVTYRGEAKLIDFGLAKARDRITSTAHGVLKGKLAYVAPEQIGGAHVDRRADIFSLGITLWECSVGDRLFRAEDDVETLRRVSKGEIPDPTTRLPDYPRALADVILKALAKSPNDRYRTAQELSVALDEASKTGRRSVEPRQVGALVRVLFPDDTARAWERRAAELVPSESSPELLADGAIVRAWDEEGQKATWMAVAVDAPDSKTTSTQRMAATPQASFRDTLDAALGERLAALGPRDDVVRARTLLERSIVEELFGNLDKAREHAEASLSARATAAVHAALRRHRRASGGAKALVELLDAEIALTSEQRVRADLLGERGRALAAADDLKSAKLSFQRALELVPAHAASLKGLETVLRLGKRADADLALHLARLADACVDEPLLAAWIYVERARLLDGSLNRRDEARASLTRALELDSSLGPVRRACVTHATIHRDAPWLAFLLGEEAEHEAKPDRAAALELEAAAIARHLLADAKRAVALLERARKRRVGSWLLRRAILDELVLLHERAGRADAALSTRRERLGLLRDVGERALELRELARLEEASGDLEHAIASLEEARRCSPDDATLVEDLDRLLERGGQTERRIALFGHQGATSMDAEARAAAALRAARIAEQGGGTARALELYRLALTAAPGSVEAIDAIDRLVRTKVDAERESEVRARIALHRHAAEHAADIERRVAHLETVALLSEEMLGELDVAAATYETILELAPKRRSALVGLARTAQRRQEPARAAAALLAESELVSIGPERDALRVRAAKLLAESDGARARSLLENVIEREPANQEARLALVRIHERAEEWQYVDRHLAAAVEYASDDADRASRLLARAEVQRGRLGARHDALDTVRAALAAQPQDARAISFAMTLLDELEDAAAAREGLLALAEGAPDEVRKRAVLRAAILAEHVLGDDAAAMDLLERLADGSEDAAWLGERSLRLATRRAHQGDPEPMVRMLEDLAARGDDYAAFDLAAYHVTGDREEAAKLTERVISAFPAAPHALRWMEELGILSKKPAIIANALAAQVEAYTSKTARLGALWAEIQLVDWTLGGDVRSDLELVLSIATDDRAALEGVIAKCLEAIRAGDEAARGPLALALRDLATTSQDETTKLAAHIALAITLHQTARGKAGEKEALREYRAALRVEPRSVVAATGCARLGAQTEDGRATVDGLLALAEMAKTPDRRAALLTQAAGALVAAGEGNLGPRAERLTRAADLLERALAADPNSVLAITMLVAVRGEDGERARLLPVLSAVLERTRSKEAIAAAGIELARVARADVETRQMAIDAVRKVIAAAPTDAAAYGLLAEICLEQGARADAAKALEAVAANAREPREKVEALFSLADLYRDGNVPKDVERVLRVVLDVDPLNTRALGQLAAMRREASAPNEELLALLTRLADVAPSGEEKGRALFELGELKLASGNPTAEQDFVEGTANAPSAARLARVLALNTDPKEQVRLLSAVVARGEQLKKPHAAAWAALGQLEIDSLRRAADGVPHVRRALALEPTMPEARAALARGLLAIGQADEAAKVVVSMMASDASPLLSLRDAGGALATLEAALAKQGRRDESIVVRELRAIAGVLDDGAHVELRARRRGPVMAAGEGTHLIANLLPEEGREALAIVQALAGIDAKVERTDLDSLGISPRQRLAGHHPAVMTVAWLSRFFGIDAPHVVMSDRILAPRPVAIDGEPWLAVPNALPSRAEPEQIALITRAIVRIALSATWLDELLPDEVLALLVATARRATPAASGPNDLDQSLVDDFSQKISRAAGRKQKKALADLAPRVLEMRALTAADAEALIRLIGRTELRAAFVITGDLLATLDAARAGQAALRRETDTVGPRALAAMLSHPITSDVITCALSPRTTSLRARLGTLWTGGAAPAAAFRTP